MDESAITCDEIIDADAGAKSNNEAKSNNKETKPFPTNFNKKIQLIKYKISIFYLPFC